jgi:DNA-binding CsgD family transcriptional regulator
MPKAKAKATPRTPIESILGISPAKAGELFVALTERERQVAELMSSGAKNRKIAAEMGISVKTLDIHRTNVRRKLNAKTAVDLVRVVYAKKFGQFLQ